MLAVYILAENINASLFWKTPIYFVVPELIGVSLERRNQPSIIFLILAMLFFTS